MSLQQDESVPCPVHVYRTRAAFHSLDAEKPFVYAGEEQAGALGVGDSLCLRLPPGRHVIAIREPVLFMPAWTSRTLEVEVAGARPVYVRYSAEFGEVAPSAAGPVVLGSRSLKLSDEASWRARQ